MADAISVQGPLVKGYSELGPMVKGSDVSGVLLREGISYVPPYLNVSFIDSSGVKREANVEITSPKVVIYRGLGPEEQVASEDEAAAKANARASFNGGVGGAKFRIDHFSLGGLVTWEAPNSQNQVSLFRPWVAFPSNLETNLLFYRDGEDDTEFWKKEGVHQVTEGSYSLWVLTKQISKQEVERVVIKNYSVEAL